MLKCCTTLCSKFSTDFEYILNRTYIYVTVYKYIKFYSLANINVTMIKIIAVKTNLNILSILVKLSHYKRKINKKNINFFFYSYTNWKSLVMLNMLTYKLITYFHPPLILFDDMHKKKQKLYMLFPYKKKKKKSLILIESKKKEKKNFFFTFLL